MTDLEKAKALIAIAEQTYIENYYEGNLSLFKRDQTYSCSDASGEHCESNEG